MLGSKLMSVGDKANFYFIVHLKMKEYWDFTG